MQDPPSAGELVRAVAGFLREDALPALTGRNAYLARVAANTLDIVARELEQAPAADAAERQRLLALLDGADPAHTLEELNAELCERIRTGVIGARTPGLLAHLWTTTLAAVAVDQPGYSGYRLALDEAAPGSGQAGDAAEASDGTVPR